ncbi:MAG: endopeptidase La [Candidatus Marinimicrobia bacterium]|nr:endopeptidase La [Candidatus Neomarinimicrobiota bacterium]MCH7954891.1 endopeptidase La [Candidatus Neomarinimicrobiota bacterium]
MEDFENEHIPEVLPILPLRNTVLFPQQVIPISIGREKSVSLISKVSETNKLIGVVAQRDGSVEHPESTDLYAWGTLAAVLKVFDMPDGSKSAIIQGLQRIKLITYLEEEPYIKAAVQQISDDETTSDLEIEAMAVNVRSVFQDIVEIAPYLSMEHTSLLANIDEPGKLVDRAISVLNIRTSEKQIVLEEVSIRRRLEESIIILNRELQRLQLGEKIQTEVQGEINKTQREYFLREQLKAIKKELGEEDDIALELRELKEKMDAAKLSEEALKVAEKELDRLNRIPPSSPEYTVSRTYLDWLIDLPWSKNTEDNMDIKEAAAVLDGDHYGLKKVKERILEYLAVRKLKSDMKGPILCFVGPPGTGKTSVGKSIAEAVGRKFVRISLGGVHDEAEIRGHRRTYIGALPGRIIQGLKKAGSNNPIFMLDEIDKVGKDFRGDPSSALLEVLDPEQNDTFSDHYLEVEFDLSKVMFIATANMVDTIPPALRDRMEIIEFSGYIEEEKTQIARKFLIPKQLAEHGLSDRKLEFEESGLTEIVHSYTRESGVRNLERQLANVSRRVAKEIVEGNKKKKRVTKANVADYLGPVKFFSDVAERTKKPGIATGLAYTPSGGDILFIEATSMPGKGKLTLTGQLGDVMKESAEAAKSFIRSQAEELGIDPKFNENTDIHIHVPAGAIPKDGPSAGVTMLSAMVSLLTGRRLKLDIAMTGEITLRGTVLPVGGIREKVLAAHRAGIKMIILPEKNKKDLEEIPKKTLRGMKFQFASEMLQVIDLALVKAPGRHSLQSSPVKGATHIQSGRA